MTLPRNPLAERITSGGEFPHGICFRSHSPLLATGQNATASASMNGKPKPPKSLAPPTRRPFSAGGPIRLMIVGLALVLASNLPAQHEWRRDRRVKLQLVDFTAAPLNDLVVEVRGSNGQPLGPIQAMGSGSFEFHGEEGEIYELTVTNERRDFVERHWVAVTASNQPLIIRSRSTEQRPRPGPAEPISTRQLLVPSKAAKELQRAENAFRAGDTQASIEHLVRAIQIHPDYLEAHNNLGARYIRLGQYEKAVTEFHKAMAIDPKVAKPCQNLGVALALLERYPEAEAAARRAIELDPDSIQLRYLLGRILAAQGTNTLEAAALLRQAASQFPNARLTLAAVLLKQGATDQAIAELRSYLQSPKAEKKQEVECWLARLTQASSEQKCGQANVAP